MTALEKLESNVLRNGKWVWERDLRPQLHGRQLLDRPLPQPNAWSSWVVVFPRQLVDSRIRFEDVHLRESAATETDGVESRVNFIAAHNSGNLSSSQPSNKTKQ